MVQDEYFVKRNDDFFCDPDRDIPDRVLIGNFSPSYLFGDGLGISISGSRQRESRRNQRVRVLGWKYGIPVFILDALKGLAAATIGASLGAFGAPQQQRSAWLLVMICLFYEFSRRKGDCLHHRDLPLPFPRSDPVGIAIFLLIILTTRLVSLGSLVFVFSLFFYLQRSLDNPLHGCSWLPVSLSLPSCATKTTSTAFCGLRKQAHFENKKSCVLRVC